MAIRDYKLPETLPFGPTFQKVLSAVIDRGYSKVADAADSYERDEKDDFDTDLANAISEACDVLNIGEAAGAATGDWLGELYDLAEAIGYAWPHDDTDQETGA